MNKLEQVWFRYGKNQLQINIHPNYQYDMIFWYNYPNEGVLYPKKEGIMEIIIGSIPPLQVRSQIPTQGNNSVIAAQLLHVRPPRKGISGPSGMERRNKPASDPRMGRVLTLMVPDGRQLPADIESGRYEVSLRFVRR